MPLYNTFLIVKNHTLLQSLAYFLSLVQVIQGRGDYTSAVKYRLNNSYK